MGGAGKGLAGVLPTAGVWSSADRRVYNPGDFGNSTFLLENDKSLKVTGS